MGRRSTALGTLKMAVLAPMPKAMVSAAVSAKMGFLRSVRKAKVTSCDVIVAPEWLYTPQAGLEGIAQGEGSQAPGFYRGAWVKPLAGGPALPQEMVLTTWRGQSEWLRIKS